MASAASPRPVPRTIRETTSVLPRPRPRTRAGENYNIEIAGGLGQLAGKVWRIGLMGYNSRKENAALVCAALRDALDAQGYYRSPGLLYKTRNQSRTSYHGSA